MKKLLKVGGLLAIIFVSVFAFNFSTTKAQTSTDKSLCYNLTKDLYPGKSIDDSVPFLRRFLDAKGYVIKPSSTFYYYPGLFDSYTSYALEDYQKNVGISTEKYLGPETRSRINKECSNNLFSVKSVTVENTIINTSKPVLRPNKKDYSVALSASFLIKNNSGVRIYLSNNPSFLISSTTKLVLDSSKLTSPERIPESQNEYITIPPGGSQAMTLNGILYSPIGEKGYFNYKITRINFGKNPVILDTYSITTGLEKLTTNLYLKDDSVTDLNSSPAPTPSPCYIFSKNLELGNKNSDVIELQKFLISKKFLASDGATGYFGNTTFIALKNYQLKNGIEQTGYFGPETREKVNAECKIVFNSPASVALLSTGTNVVTGAEANDDVGYFTVKFSVTAANSDVYVSSIVSKALDYIIDKSGVATSSKSITASLVDNTDTELSPVGNYIIKGGETERFTLLVSVPLGNGGTSGQYRLTLTNLRYGLRDLLSYQSKVSLKDFKTNYQVVNSGESALASKIKKAGLPNESTIRLEAKNKGIVNNSYQINLSFIGGSSLKPVTKWMLNIPCDTYTVDATTVPGAACGSFEMGNRLDYGNVIDKEFWFKNNSGIAQKIIAVLDGYDSSNNLIGSAKSELNIPPTTTGPISWQEVTLVSPNGGQTINPGSKLEVRWSTVANGFYKFKATDTVTISILKKTTSVAKFDNSLNDGVETITLPANIGSGSDYKVYVTVHSKSGDQADISDRPFTISPSTSPAPTVGIVTPYITITSPNGGERLYVGQTYPISFVTNLTDKQTSGISLQLYKKTNDSFGRMYVQDIVLNWNGGSPYKWAIPSSISSGEYYLYAAGNNLRNINQKEVIDFSDRTFTITSPSTSPSPSLTVAPIIPSITSIQSPANPVGIVDSGSRAVIYGTGLKGKLTIKLGAQEPRFVTINSNTSDTSAEFIVPSQNFSSVVSVIVTNSSGKTSNFYEIRINAAVVSSTPTPVASIAPVVTATPTPSPSATQTPSPTATTDVVDRREAIRQLYLTLLRREPDAAGLDYWVSTSYTIDQVKQQFLNGAEYQNLIRTTANPSSSASPSVSASAPVFRATLWDAVKVLFGF